MITIRKSQDRGQADHGWLQSQHTFSFAGYYDPNHMGVSALRVINDDHVKPGQGFATHSHQDMEIISYVKQGVIEHKDSMGNVERLPAGEFQLMSAGTGVTHSEYNPSTSESLEFLQIWVQPNKQGVEPGYQQKEFPIQEGLQLIASPDAREGSLRIYQDAMLYQLRLESGEQSYDLSNGRTLYLHLISGRLEIDDEVIEAGDGVTIQQQETLQIKALEKSEGLLFDLP